MTLFPNELVAFTGHRNLLGDGNEWLLPFVCDHFRKGGRPRIAIVGMALGFDQAVAKACIVYGIPYIAAVPFQGQEKLWPLEAQRKYFALLDKAAKVVTVSNGGYTVGKMQARNQYMVKLGTRLVALWDGLPGTGTANCVNYANSQALPVENLWKDWLQWRAHQHMKH